MWSSLFHPPWFCFRLKWSVPPSGNSTGFSGTKTATRGAFRRPGPASMPHAVSSLPSMANATGPVTRFLPLLSSKFFSRSRSGLP